MGNEAAASVKLVLSIDEMAVDVVAAGASCCNEAKSAPAIIFL